MTSLPKTLPPLPRNHRWKRELPVRIINTWLHNGWNDFRKSPGSSLLYGFTIYLVSLAIVFGLFYLKLDYILFPVFSGFLIVGPTIAIGLYEKSRRLASKDPIKFTSLVFVKPRSGGQILFAGVLLALLMLLWLRAAVILYALFFGLLPFQGLNEIAPQLFHTSAGWSLMVTGSLVGGLFAAFAYAISVFSLPMLMNEKTDALSAMGASLALVWNNLPVMLAWGAVVLALFLVSIVSGFIGLIVIFPLLGHATWHAYRTFRPENGNRPD
ncbi:DUF2189 domain-containing protein [Emcibacter sp.]|uniref:DUF2189 domain-containing protein n=1 Tax=Emcibacter sp. TaxID=1979954 RepID=UPI003A8CCE20